MTSTPEQVIAKIREALEAWPTPGPWEVDDPNRHLVARKVNGVYEYICAVEPETFAQTDHTPQEDDANAKFIAACNPQNIAVLIQSHEDFKADYFRRHKDSVDHLERALAAEAERDALRKALTDVRGSIKNARGAVESNQVVDKDVHGTLSRAIRMIDAALQSAADTPAPQTQKPSDAILAILDEAAGKSFAASISDMSQDNLLRLRAAIDAALSPFKATEE